MSLSQGATPDCWKLANIIPIYKGIGSCVNVKNYRPISLTSVFCKTMEKLLKNIIVDFLDNNNLFHLVNQDLGAVAPLYHNLFSLKLIL